MDLKKNHLQVYPTSIHSAFIKYQSIWAKDANKCSITYKQ